MEPFALTSLSRSRVLPCRIRFDPVVCNLRTHTDALRIEDDQVRFLPRHMAIDAILRERMIRSRERCRVRFVADEASLGKLHCVVLGSVDIMTGEAGHV